MEFLQLNEDEFTQFAKHHELDNLWQTKEMAAMREQRGYQTYYVGVKENDKIIAGTMLSSISMFMGYHLFQACRGYLIDFQNEALVHYFHEHLETFLKAHKCLYLHIDPYLPYKERDLDGNVVENGFDHSGVVNILKNLGYRHEGFTRGIDLTREPRWIYTIDLKNKTPEDVLKQFERKTLRSVKKAINYNIQVRELDRESLPLFEEVMKHTEERRGFEGRGEDYYTRLYDVYSKNDNIKFLYAELFVEDYKKDLLENLADDEKEKAMLVDRLSKQESHKMQKKLDLLNERINQLHKKLKEADELAKTDGETLVLASGVFFTYGREVLCLMSGVYEKYMKFSSPYAMHWHMINYAIEQKMDRYNLYGISGNFEATALDYGVYLFKKGFQGEVLELIGDFEYIVNPFMYRCYQSLRKIKHIIKK